MCRCIINLCGRKRSGKESAFKLLAPYVRKPQEFQFATPIKNILMNVLGLSYAQCYGTTEERESATKYKWDGVAENIRNKYGKNVDDLITAREIHQLIGTDLFREQFYKDIWAEAGVLLARSSNAETMVFSDSRFTNEIMACDASGIKNITIRLYRETGLSDQHTSETALDYLDLEPQQRCIKPEWTERLLNLDFQRISDSLWRKKPENNHLFSYLLDNNSTLEILHQNLLFILKENHIFTQPSLA